MLAKEPAGALYGWGFRNQLNVASSDAKAVFDGDACQAARIPILYGPATFRICSRSRSRESLRDMRFPALTRGCMGPLVVMLRCRSGDGASADSPAESARTPPLAQARGLDLMEDVGAINTVGGQVNALGGKAPQHGSAAFVDGRNVARFSLQERLRQTSFLPTAYGSMPGG